MIAANCQRQNYFKRSPPSVPGLLNGRWIFVFCSLAFLYYSCDDTSDTGYNDPDRLSEVNRWIEAGAHYESLYEIDSALMAYSKARQLVDSIESFTEKIIVYGKLGQIYLYRKGEILKAEEFLVNQRNLLESGSGLDLRRKIENYQDLSFLYFKKQDYPYAESYSMMAYLAYQEQDFSDSFLLSQIFTSLGNINNQVLDSMQAIHFFNKASAYYPLDNKIPGRKHPWMVGYINYYNNSGPPDSAIYWLDQLKMQVDEDICGLAEHDRLYSIFHLLGGDNSESIRHALKSIEYYRLCKNPDPFNSVRSYILLSSALRAAKLHDEAIVFLDSALVIKFGEGYALSDLQSDIFSVSTLASKAEIIGDQGIHLRDTLLIHTALSIYDTIELLLTHFTKFDIDGFLANKYYNNFYYTKLMEYYSFMFAETTDEKWLYQIHNTITSYKAQSFSREKALFELSRSEAGKNTAFKGFIKNDYELEKLIFEVNHLPFEDKIKRSKELNAKLAGKSRIRKKLEEEHTEIYQKMVASQNITANELLSYSEINNTAIINYYIGDRFYNSDKIYVLIASKGQFLFYNLKNDIELTKVIDSIYRIHMNPSERESANNRAGYEEMSFHLYERLVSDFYPEIRGAKEVIIIPDEKLHQLSFDAIRMKKPESDYNEANQYNQSYCLIDSLNISYAYSPNRIKEDKTELPKYKLMALGMGFSDKETIEKRRLESLAELRSSYLELESIKKYYHNEKVKYFTGFSCTKSNFFKYAPSAQLIHLSTHGGYQDDIRNSGMLYMSEGKGVGKMYQHELRFANIGPEILILSACDSGAGELYTEEGMMSIGRIFQAYGTKKVISALWPLTDRASTELFNTFYEFYTKDTDANVSLRNAKLKMLHSNTSHSFPGYWAGLILYN